MEKQRASEIINSLGVIEVLHRSSPVWLEEVDDVHAFVKYLDRDVKSRVLLAELHEKE